MKTVKQATGKKKTSIAMVSISESKKHAVIINGVSAESYFSAIDFAIQSFLAPIEKAGLEVKNFVINITVKGGGLSSQMAAIKHAVAKAIAEISPEIRSIIKKLGFLTRDARRVERKKSGLRKARRKEQFSKR